VGAAIGSMLGFAAGVAVSPLPIVAIILLLATPNGRTTGSLFAAGWLTGLTVLSVVVLVIVSSAGGSSDGGPAKGTGWLKLALGAWLVVFSVRQWRGRPKDGAEPKPPKWMATLDTLSAGKAFGLGAALATINPKNGALTIAAAAAIAGTGTSGVDQGVAIALFVIIASLGVAAPLAVFLFTGEKAVHTLESWRHWFVQNNTAIMAVLFFVIGLKLVGDGIAVVS
jgi:threonine/homoserine/homoserine lactone efflux protein